MKWFLRRPARYSTALVGVLLSTLSSTYAGGSPPGWKWYNEPKQRPVAASAKRPPLPPNTTTTVMSAREQMQWFHRVYEEINAEATLNPRNEHTYLRLMQLNHFISEKSSQAGMTFKKLLLAYPEYSYVKDHPVEQAARARYYQLKREQKVAMVGKMKDEGWGFFFIYNGADPLSQALAPSLQNFADTYGLELLGVSQDGQFIEDIRQNRVNDNTLLVPFVPALILVNPRTAELTPLAYGFISQEALLDRFYHVATRYQSPDF